MSTKLQTIAAQPLTVEAFAPFGDVLTPKARRLDNRDLLELGYARMSDQVPPERVADVDILDYWGDIATITREPMRLGYLRSRQRPLQFSWFERHLKGTQTFIPLGGAPSVFAVAEPKDLDDPNALPDLTSMRAFVMDGSAGVNIAPGTWHWTPFPLADHVDFIILVREDVVDDDLNFVDLEARLGVRVAVSVTD